MLHIYYFQSMTLGTPAYYVAYILHTTVHIRVITELGLNIPFEHYVSYITLLVNIYKELPLMLHNV